MSSIYQSGANGLWVFVALTVLLGGAAAFTTGQAIAQSWKPYWQLVWYMVLLAAAVRFFHYALFAEPLVALASYLIDLTVLLVFAAAGHHLTRNRQMRDQYGWAHSPPTNLPP